MGVGGEVVGGVTAPPPPPTFTSGEVVPPQCPVAKVKQLL